MKMAPFSTNSFSIGIEIGGTKTQVGIGSAEQWIAAGRNHAKAGHT